MESDLGGKSSRRHIVGAAESGQKIVERQLVGQVDNRELSAPFSFVAVEDIVVADGHIEKIARANSLRIVIIILRVRSRDAHQIRSELRRRANARQRLHDGCARSGAGEASLKFLIGRQGGACDRVDHVDCGLTVERGGRTGASSS